jgi:iron-sulfur cluster assembly protein
MISITSRALSEAKRIFAEKNIPDDYALRLLVEGGGGCGGAKFRLGFDKQKSTDDATEIEGLKIIFEKKSLMFLLSVELDFEERESERGFVFRAKK